MRGLWQGVEGYLRSRFPQTMQLITTDKDPMFDDQEYQQFLSELGYWPVGQALYEKVPVWPGYTDKSP